MRSGSNEPGNSHQSAADGRVRFQLRCANNHLWELSGDELVPGRFVGTICPSCMGPTVAICRAPAHVEPGASSDPLVPGLVETTAFVEGTAPTRREPVDPEMVPGFAILETLGRGGMGVVYKAEHLGLKRIVALKMLLAGAHASDKDLLRFRREAEVIARLQHPNIIQIYHTGEHLGQPYLVMEFAGSGTLRDRMGNQSLPARQAVLYLRTLAHAVGAAHQVGVIHRDLKPGNVLIAADGTLKITDFGLAKEIDENTELTSTGAIMGTPAYMAPEQAAGRVQQIGTATDVYALGVVFYEMLTGHPPFKGPTVMDTMNLIRETNPIPPSKSVAGLDRDLDLVCLKCLAKQPRDRYADASALACEMDRYLSGQPVEAALQRPLIEKIAEQVVQNLAERQEHEEREKAEQTKRADKVRQTRDTVSLLLMALVVLLLFLLFFGRGLF